MYWSVSSTISCTSRQCSCPVRRTHAACKFPGRHTLTAQQPSVEERPTVWQRLSFAERMHDCFGAASDLLQELLNHILDGDDAQWSALRHARKIGLLQGNTGRGLQRVLFVSLYMVHSARAPLPAQGLGQGANNEYCSCKAHSIWTECRRPERQCLSQQMITKARARRLPQLLKEPGRSLRAHQGFHWQ